MVITTRVKRVLPPVLIGIVSRVLSFVYYHAGKSTFLRRHAPAALKRCWFDTPLCVLWAKVGPERILIGKSRETNRQKASRCTLSRGQDERIPARETANPFSLFGN